MGYKRSIGVMRQDDWNQVMDILENHLSKVQQDSQSTNDQINDMKMLIQRLEQHIDSPARQTYSFKRYY